MASPRRLPVWLLVASAALLAAVLTLTVDRGIAMLRLQPPPMTVVPTVMPVSVVVQPPEPPLRPASLPAGEQEQLVQQLQQQSAWQWGCMFILKAERQIDLALDALTVNDMARADRELAAATTSLDEAFRLAPEDLKPQIDSERFTISRVRADLIVNPQDLDQELRRLRDRLLALISPFLYE
jgi:hypothetical protein